MKQSSYEEKSDLLCVQRFGQRPRPTAVVVVRRREETRWVRYTARRTHASEPRLTASGLAAKRRGECARVNLSWYFVFRDVIATAAATAVHKCSLRVRIHGEVRA